MTNSIEIEQILLGSCFFDERIISCLTGIQPEYFSNEVHKNIWNLLLTYRNSNMKVYLPSMISEISKFFGGAENGQEQASSFCASLVASGLPLTKNDCTYYVQQIKTAYTKRLLVDAMEKTRKDIVSGTCPMDIIEKLQHTLTELRTATKTVGEVESIGDIANRCVQALECKMKGEGEKPTPTGFYEIDHALGGGVYKGGLHLIGGSTGMGKTVMGLTLAWNMVKAGGKALYFNVEMFPEHMVDRILSNEANVNHGKIRSGEGICQSEFEKIFMASQEMQGKSFMIDSRADISFDEVLLTIREQHRQGKVDFVFIDYIQLLFTSQRHMFDRRDQELNYMAVQLFRLAKELQITIFCFAQLNDDMSKRDNKRPTMSDVKDSKSMAHSCENVWILFREEYYHDAKKPSDFDIAEMVEWEAKKELLKGFGEVILAKNRHGQPITSKVKFEGKYMRYSNAD